MNKQGISSTRSYAERNYDDQWRLTSAFPMHVIQDPVEDLTADQRCEVVRTRGPAYTTSSRALVLQPSYLLSRIPIGSQAQVAKSFIEMPIAISTKRTRAVLMRITVLTPIWVRLSVTYSAEQHPSVRKAWRRTQICSIYGSHPLTRPRPQRQRRSR